MGYKISNLERIWEKQVAVKPCRGSYCFDPPELKFYENIHKEEEEYAM